MKEGSKKENETITITNAILVRQLQPLQAN
jgi:hypothetical protein